MDYNTHQQKLPVSINDDIKKTKREKKKLFLQQKDLALVDVELLLINDNIKKITGCNLYNVITHFDKDQNGS